MTCAPNEDSDQPGYPPSLIRVFAVEPMGGQEPKASSYGQQRPYQTGRIPKLIRVFAGGTEHFVGFVVLWLIYQGQ